MALHDYLCNGCGYLLADQYRSVEEGAQARLPFCPRCHCLMQWVPQVGRMDLLSESAKFVQYDGQNNPVVVDSFAAMRRLEAESDQQYRNGEGQPIRFRALHQSHSNMDRNTFGEGPAVRPSVAGKQKFGLGGGAKVLSGEPDVEFGPGVNESNTSALKD